MNARRIWLALALLALPAALVFLGLARRSRSPVAAQAGAADEGRSAVGPAPLAAPAETERAPLEATATHDAEDARVTVRSALGLPLARIEFEERDGSWRAADLVQGALRLPFAARPTNLRAPGHLATEVVASTRALVLEAHTSLVFTSFPVARVKTWTPTDGWDEFRPAAEALCSAGATDASTWAIALDASRLRALFPHLALRFDLDDGTQADVTHELAAGRQDVYAWPRAPLDVRTEPLAVEVEDAAWEHGVFRVEVHARPDSLAAPPGRALWSEATAWGRVVLLDYIELIRASSQEPRLELGPLVIGKRYVVTMRDEASGDHARAFFVHDGSVVRLRLAGGVRVHGLLDVTPAEPIDHLERVVWTFGERPGSAYWFAEPQQVPVAADGSFALVLPDPVPFAERAPFPRPDALALEFRAGGFEPRKLAVDTAGRREIDLGAVRLESLPAQFVLAAGHGLEAEHLGDQDVEVADAAAGVTLSYHLAGARLRADGALDVALELGKGGAGFQVRVGKSRDARGWSAPDALVLSIDGEGFPFVRGGDGLLHPEPAREFTLRLETDPSLARDPLRLGVGWEWNGIRHWIRSWAPEAREAPLEASFRAPVHGATLWWVLGDDVGAAHAVGELGEPALVLRVP